MARQAEAVGAGCSPRRACCPNRTSRSASSTSFSPASSTTATWTTCTPPYGTWPDVCEISPPPTGVHPRGQCGQTGRAVAALADVHAPATDRPTSDDGVHVRPGSFTLGQRTRRPGRADPADRLELAGYARMPGPAPDDYVPAAYPAK